MRKNLVIKLVRHGESESNIEKVDPREVGDHRIELTRKGFKQAKEAGKLIGADFMKSALFYRSPFKRTRQTSEHMLRGAGVNPKTIRFLEDPRLREVDTGYEDYESQKEMRELYGFFYYRFGGGQAPTDRYGDVCTFLESLDRQVERKDANKVVIATHGLTLRVIVMRMFHLTVEQFEALDNPRNCDVVTIAHKNTLKNPQLVSGKWGVRRASFRKKEKRKAPKSGQPGTHLGKLQFQLFRSMPAFQATLATAVIEGRKDLVAAGTTRQQHEAHQASHDTLKALLPVRVTSVLGDVHNKVFQATRNPRPEREGWIPVMELTEEEYPGCKTKFKSEMPDETLSTENLQYAAHEVCEFLKKGRLGTRVHWVYDSNVRVYNLNLEIRIPQKAESR